jgi:hypothetical protein
MTVNKDVTEIQESASLAGKHSARTRSIYSMIVFPNDTV